MESIYEARLLSEGWPERAAKQAKWAWAESTRALYNRMLTKLKVICTEQGTAFPPTIKAEKVIAKYLCAIADSSEKPGAQLKSAVAALAWMYNCAGVQSPMATFELNALSTALIKSATSKPSLRTKVMPCLPFFQLFEKWGQNESLDLERLRLKAITLLALVCMTRPSDLAPHGVVFDPLSLEVTDIAFSTDQVTFHDDGSMTIVFFGIKNDGDRKGFEVHLPAGSKAKLDPVACLRHYIAITEKDRPASQAVFLPLRKPFKALASTTISKILAQAIILAGLGSQGYTARSFRPTGATAAIEGG